MVVADLDFDLINMSTGQRWLRGRRPELYGVITEVQGNELGPREARFSNIPTAPGGVASSRAIDRYFTPSIYGKVPPSISTRCFIRALSLR